MLRQILQQRVRDGVVLRLIGKWLNAGVLEDGALVVPESGTPQGGVISPILANIYLHEVLDQWFEHEVKPRLASKAVLVRYADDAAMLFANEEDAQRVLAVLPKRLSKYGLTLHPTKTRLTPFRRPDRKPPPGGNPAGAGTFDLLGFTHFWGKSRQGKWIVKRQTARDRFGRALSRVMEWCRGHRHDAVREQHRVLAAKLRGHFQYFGVTGNWRMLARFRYEVIHVWYKWLRRRSQRTSMTWERLDKLLERYLLPWPRIAPRHPSRVANP
jgi:hypothetical protein